MAALSTVADYVTYARILLQDQVAPYRYPDQDLLLALTSALPDAKKLRPDLFLSTTTLPVFSAVDSTVVPMDQMYRMPILYYVVGMAQLRDDEEVQDQRAAAFLNLFEAKLKTAV